MNLLEHLHKISKSEPDRICLLNPDGTSLSYAELLSVIERAHNYFHDNEISSTNPILVLLPNGIDQAVLFLAASVKGFSYAPLACTATLAEIESVAQIIGAKTILVGSNLPSNRVKEISDLGFNLFVLKVAAPLEWLSEKNHKPNTEQYTPGNLLITTSGSTSSGKVVQLNFEKLWLSACEFSKIHDCDSKSLVFWNYLPMSYLGGLFNLLLIPIAGGNTSLIDDAFSGNTLIRFWHVVEQFQINALWLVPTILRGLIQLSRFENRAAGDSILRTFIGTAPVRLAELNEFQNKFGIYPLQNYGLTETTFISTQTGEQLSGSQNKLQEGSVGEILNSVKIKTIPFVNEESEISNQFEIWVKTPYLMDGYWYEGASHPNLELDQDGYFNTGDLGHLQAGQLVLTGRQKDVIKRGGHLIILSEIEKVATSSGIASTCAAIKIEHKFYGEAFVLAIEMENSNPESIGRLETYIQGKLSKNKWPEAIIVVKNLARTSSGKISKPAVLRQIQELGFKFRMPSS